MASALRFPLQVRFGDIDSYGHVNNVAFLSYLETARVQLVHTPLGASAGAEPGQTLYELLGEENYTLVGRQEIEYRAPLLFRPEPVFVAVRVTRLGGSSYDLGYSVEEEDGSTVYAVASTSMVLVSRANGTPVRLTPAQRHAFGTWAGAPVDFRRRPADAR